MTAKPAKDIPELMGLLNHPLKEEMEAVLTLIRKWLGKDRASVKFHNRNEVETNGLAFQEIKLTVGRVRCKPAAGVAMIRLR